MSRRKSAFVGFLTIFLIFAANTAHARMINNKPSVVLSESRVPNILIVKFADDVRPAYPRGISGDAVTGLPSVDRLNSDFRLRSYRRLFPGARVPEPGSPRKNLTGYCVLEFPMAVDIDAAYEAYQADPQIEHVEFDYFATIMRVPNDSYYSSQWALNQMLDHDIDAPEAWDIAVGDPDVILADTDTGVLYTHEDLVDNIWVNPGEDLDSDGVVWDPDDINGVDDDGNGYRDDIIGYDFVEYTYDVWFGEDGERSDNDPMDFNGHGTHTSGTFAATTNNNKGVAGVAGGFGPGVEPGCRIMCLRMGYSFDDGGWENGRTHMSFVAEAFNYAANNGAVAINYSFGSSSGGGIIGATNDAVAAGLVISASAGNDATNNSAYFGYLQKRSDVLCVAATNSSDYKWGGSNWGPLVDVSAPGSSVRSTVSYHYTPGYAYYSGTSMAAPHVVGLVGLLKSVNPTLTREQLFDIILTNADNIDHLNPSYAGGLGAGRINAFNSLNHAAVADFSAVPTGGDVPLEVDFTESSPGGGTDSWVWDFGDGDSAVVQDPTHVYDEPGLYDVSLRITSNVGNGYVLKSGYIYALDEEISVPSIDALRGDTVVLEINLDNNVPVAEIYLPLSASQVTADAYLDSVATAGCRTEYFELQEIVYADQANGQLCLHLKADAGGESSPLEPGNGPIARAYLRVRPDATVGHTIELSAQPMDIYGLEFWIDTRSFQPRFVAGGITVEGVIGDLDGNNEVNPIDAVLLVNQVYKNAPPPAWPDASDTNCDGQYNPLDVVLMVDRVYRNGPLFCQ